MHVRRRWGAVIVVGAFIGCGGVVVKLILTTLIDVGALLCMKTSLGGSRIEIKRHVSLFRIRIPYPYPYYIKRHVARIRIPCSV